MNISANFKRKEFACKGLHCCNHSAPVHPDLIAGLQELRDRLKSPIHITSGFRCNTHNRNVGGAPNSYHTLGMAADIITPGMTPLQLYEMVNEIDLFRMGGIGIYKNFIHVDVRQTGPARW
ncbi:MAG: YcbK family protein [Desulfomonilaceae bacterium]